MRTWRPMGQTTEFMSDSCKGNRRINRHGESRYYIFYQVKQINAYRNVEIEFDNYMFLMQNWCSGIIINNTNNTKNIFIIPICMLFTGTEQTQVHIIIIPVIKMLFKQECLIFFIKVLYGQTMFWCVQWNRVYLSKACIAQLLGDKKVTQILRC